jgi:4-hydroxybenzoate polyprenyltransferase
VGIAAAAGRNPSAWFSVPVIIFFLFFLYPANSYIYGINDIYDYETDRLNPKKIQYESLVLPSERKSLFQHIAIICAPFLIVIFAIGCFIHSWAAVIALLAFFFFAGFYSAEPIRAKARPFLDSTFSAGHYVATGIFSYLLVESLLHNTVSIGGVATCAIAGMFWAISMHAYSAVPDIKADRDAGLATIATKLKKRNTLLLCAVLYALSGIFAIPYLGGLGLLMAGAYVALMLLSIDTSEKQLFKIYTFFPALNTIVGMAVFFLVLLKQ